MRLEPLLCLFALLLATPAMALAGERVALVIGNGDYAHASKLPNPPTDARAMAGALRNVGFEVFEGIDLDQRAMQDLTRRFLRALDGAEAGLVFYAGHGLQVDGENYVLPIDARLEHASDLSYESLSLSDLMRQIESSERASIVILDACRNNPLTRSFQRKTRSANVGQGLARLSAGTGSLIAFATAPGETALDGQGRHSPFTAALLRHLDEPGLEINQLMTRVRADVYAGTGQEQLPWTNSALLGEFYLVPRPGAPQSVASPRPSTPVIDEEAATFEAARLIQNPNGQRRALDHYLSRYPDGRFADLARVMRNDLAERIARKTPTTSASQVPAAASRQTPSGPFEIGRCTANTGAAWAGTRLLSQDQCRSIGGAWASMR